MARYNSRLITPPAEEEEIYPYRRVWPSLTFEISILFAVVLVIYLLTRFVNIPTQLYQPINVVLALVPMGLWLAFSWWRERSAVQPRSNLVTLALVTGLVAQAIATPFIQDIIQPERWLSIESAINRIVGYTFTVGIVQAISIYLVMRYTVSSDQYRVRLDGVAYGIASAVGYATVANLQYALAAPVAPSNAAMHLFNQVAILMCNAIIIGYGLSEVIMNSRPFPLILAAAIGLSAFVTGVALPLIAGFTNAGLSVEFPISSASPIRGFLFAAGLLFVLANVFSFLFNVADRQEAELRIEETESLST
ncbi:MAG: hypothetical protein CL610_09855 [Anaerolineaceae bacterium]|nr:hypothetical protein [Anaerolineaceae bacterium]